MMFQMKQLKKLLPKVIYACWHIIREFEFCADNIINFCKLQLYI